MTGRRWASAYAALVDRWVVELAETHLDCAPGVAVVATGGYGRGLLAPGSDLDLWVIHAGRTEPSDLSRFWYATWDAGFKVGHATRSIDEAIRLARTDLATATSMLSLRHLAGDESVSHRLASRWQQEWRSGGCEQARRLLMALGPEVERPLEVAFALEPDLKGGRGGLRDLSAIGWAAAAGVEVPELSDAAADALWDARVELHRVTGRSGDLLALEFQDDVAAALGIDADALMARVASAGREIGWAAEELWFDLSQGTRRRDRRPVRVDADLTLRLGRLEIHPGAALDAAAPLRLAAVAARRGARLSRSALERLATAPLPSEPWSEVVRAAFVDLLSLGPATVGAVEALDHAGLWVRYVPEWDPIRSRPQRNAYHRYTIDRHLLETAVKAAPLRDRVGRPDLLVLSAFLHDIGKGREGDHTEVGIELVRSIGPRWGLSPEDVDTLVALVEHHLLLPDTATRRDLDDPATLDLVAGCVRTTERLELLHALTIADSQATGPAAWGSWKATLVDDLVRRTTEILAGAAPTEVVRATVPAEWQSLIAEASATGETVVHHGEDDLVVVAPDRPGLLNRVAGALALSGLDVLAATAMVDSGVALDHFRVQPSRGSIDWDRVADTVRRAVQGRLAVGVRLADRARTYPPPPRTSTNPPRVTFLTDASHDATVVEVFGPDRVGLLYELTRALAELDLDVSRAKVATIGADVVDTFYLRDRNGEMITDREHLAEIDAALRAVLDGG
jgi:[protein-PII] uridylyltransferase